MSRFSNSGNPPSAGFDLTSLGFPAYMQQQANKDIYSRFPNVAVNGMTNLGQQTAAGIRFTPTSHNLAASMTKVLSRHTLKAGLEYRKFFLNFWQEATPGGAFSYGQDWTQQNPVRNVATQGFGVASLLLGLGSGSQQKQPLAGPHQQLLGRLHPGRFPRQPQVDPQPRPPLRTRCAPHRTL